MACEKCSANGDNVKHKQRESAEKKALLTRLSRIEGQVRGVRALSLIHISEPTRLA